MKSILAGINHILSVIHKSQPHMFNICHFPFYKSVYSLQGSVCNGEEWFDQFSFVIPFSVPQAHFIEFHVLCFKRFFTFINRKMNLTLWNCDLDSLKRSQNTRFWISALIRDLRASLILSIGQWRYTMHFASCRSLKSLAQWKHPST
jgi:hypothetical protein